MNDSLNLGGIDWTWPDDPVNASPAKAPSGYCGTVTVVGENLDFGNLGLGESTGSILFRACFGAMRNSYTPLQADGEIGLSWQYYWQYRSLGLGARSRLG